MILLLACTEELVTPPKATEIPWTEQRPPLDEQTADYRWTRGIIHLHSHYSHDACDGDPMPDGIPDENCLQDLRDGLCATGMDFAYITDHPAHAAYQNYEDLLLQRQNDQIEEGIANRITCPDAHTVLLMPGIEDELMPIGLQRHVEGSPEEREILLNGTDNTTFQAEMAAGALIMQAHTEGKDIDTLRQRQSMGLTGVEIFNLHAMFDPNKREEDLGLDPLGYIGALTPFIAGTNNAQPDLSFLAVYQEQSTSLQKWDTLSQIQNTTAIAGTDAHQNVLPALMPDGERGDSYRRMMSWFSNIILTENTTPEAYQDAIQHQRLFIAFESLGTPTGFDVHYDDQWFGGQAPTGGTLTVTCPTLAPNSPQMGSPPEITVKIIKDGQIWKEDCGTWTLDTPGVYRVQVDIVPHHLQEFLGTATDLIHPYPWLYTNAFRIGL